MSDTFYDGPLFHLNKKLLVAVGLWPYGRSRFINRTAVQVYMIGSMIPHIIASVLHTNDIDRCMLSVLAFLVLATIVGKHIGLSVADKNLRRLFEELEHNWANIKDTEERKILTEYANIAKIVTIVYAIAFVVLGMVISTLPLTPIILDKLFPLESGKARQEIYLLKGEFFLDRKNHFTAIFFCDLGATMSAATVSIVADACYVVVVQQSCALYTIVSRRLRALRPMGSDPGTTATMGTANESSSSYHWLIQIMLLHRVALDFTNTVTDAYSRSFFFTFVANMVLIPLNACAILANLDNLINLLPFALLFVAMLVHFFIIFFVGQRIVNHGETLYDAAFNNEWYRLPISSRRLYIIMLIRASKPSVMSAGGLMLINFETFTFILKTGVSYITVMASFRQSD